VPHDGIAFALLSTAAQLSTLGAISRPVARLPASQASSRREGECRRRCELERWLNKAVSPGIPAPTAKIAYDTFQVLTDLHRSTNEATRLGEDIASSLDDAEGAAFHATNSGSPWEARTSAWCIEQGDGPRIAVETTIGYPYSGLARLSISSGASELSSVSSSSIHSLNTSIQSPTFNIRFRFSPVDMEEHGDIMPKVEEVEDDDDSGLSSGPTIKTSEPLTPVGVGTAPSPPAGRVPTAANSTTGRRPRGRPRKHPVVPASSSVQKTTKGRSKTGCITCRRRKKKCDETKPECLNCQKNAVVCEGYPEKTFWQPGKQRSEEGMIHVRWQRLLRIPG
jgi:Fungal Zn(2)-Cys(6) binuclear cluster domain